MASQQSTCVKSLPSSTTVTSSVCAKPANIEKPETGSTGMCSKNVNVNQKSALICDAGKPQELTGSQGQLSSQGMSNSQTKYSPQEIERKKQLALAKRKSKSQQLKKWKPWFMCELD